MSTITLLPSRLQIHQEYGAGLVLQDSNYYSIAPKQKKLTTTMKVFIHQLYILSLFAEFYRSEGPNQEVATKVQDKASPVPSTGEISAATRHYNKGANGAPNVVLLFPGNCRLRYHWILYSPTLEPYGSGPPIVGDKRAGSPGSGNQSGEKKQRSDQENNDRNDDKAKKGNGQGPDRTKREFNQPFTKKLCCLFFKLDPLKYQCCVGYKITEWDRLLQHLKRTHLIRGDHCPKCRKEFEGELAEAKKNEHIRQDTCIEKTALETGLLLLGEYEDLTGLHGSHREKWYKAWKKLFGEQRAPHSPFFETVECMLEVQHDSMQRELPTLLETFRRAVLSRPEDDTAPATIDAILSLLRNPIPATNSLVHGEPQAVLAPPILAQTPWPQDVPPSHDPEPWYDTREAFRPGTGDSYYQPPISTLCAGPFVSQDGFDGSFWPQPLEELASLEPVPSDVDESFDQWINCPDDRQYFEELGNSRHTLD